MCFLMMIMLVILDNCYHYEQDVIKIHWHQFFLCSNQKKLTICLINRFLRYILDDNKIKHGIKSNIEFITHLNLSINMIWSIAIAYIFRDIQTAGSSTTTTTTFTYAINYLPQQKKINDQTRSNRSKPNW